jgi:hypothetical protein
MYLKGTVVALLAAFAVVFGATRLEAQDAAPPPEWTRLTTLDRTERLIQFSCNTGLINFLVKGPVRKTKTYAEYGAKFVRYESNVGWVDFGGEWKAQPPPRPGYFTVRAAGIKDLRSFSEFAFLAGRSKTFVREFFREPEHAHLIQSGDGFDAIIGEVAQVTFRYEKDKLKSLSFDCSV